MTPAQDPHGGPSVADRGDTPPPRSTSTAAETAVIEGKRGLPRRTSDWVLRRPELGVIVAALTIFTVFATVAGDRGFLTRLGTENYLQVAAELGILATAVCLLMVAGEFDLSIGSMIGAAGMLIAIPVISYGWPLWAAVLLAFAVATVVGCFNAFLVIRTGLPSIIVTLGALFMLRGLTVAIGQDSSDLVSVGGLREQLQDDPLAPILAGEIGGFPVSILWWLGITLAGAWLLTRTKFGNWTMATGGDREAARKLGVPTDRVRVLLFIATASAATLVGAISTVTAGSADVLRGSLKEFEAVTAVVIGGTLLTGGYGSVIGAAVGALIFGMVNQGLIFAGIDNNWFQVFLGAMLLASVGVNQWIRTRVTERR